MTTVHLTHFDLDAVVSTVIAKKAFEINYSKCGGYGKVASNIQDLIGRGTHLVVTDLNLTEEQMDVALHNFSRIDYFDHHLPSEVFTTYNEPNLNVFYSKKMSGTALVYKYWVENGGKPTKEINNLVMLTDTYDMWRLEHPLFMKGKQLNDLFWQMGYWAFENRITNGFVDFTSEEKQYLKTLDEKRRTIVDEAPKEWLSEKSLLVLLPDREAMGEVQFLVDSSIYYIITHNGEGYSCSYRIKTENQEIDINKVLKELVDTRDELQSGGGHRLAGGSIFNPKLSITEVMDFIKNEIEPRLNIL